MFAHVNPGPMGVITDLFGEDPHWPTSMTIVQVPDGTQRDWMWDGTTATPPQPAPLDLKAYAASARYARQIAGIIVGNAPIATDLDSISMITSAYNYTQANPTLTVHFKTGGGFVTLSKDQVTAIANAVGAHVQACFAAEQQIDAGLSASPPTITTVAQIDAVFAGVAA